MSASTLPPLPDDSRTLRWPFFDDAHRQLRAGLMRWSSEQLQTVSHDEARVDDTCRELVTRLGDAGWLRHAVAGQTYGGAHEVLDTRSLCLLRETLAWHHGLADFAFAMQGLGSGAISLKGTPEQQADYLPRVAKGDALAAFALSEPDAGSDVAAMQCSATATADGYVLNGRKTWISNGGIADFYVVFARTGEAPGARGISAFIVDADTPGLSIEERIDVVAPHPLATLKFYQCKVAASQRIGEAGQGFKVAMATLDVFRTSVAAAALGFGRRALHESIAWARSRKMFGQSLGDFQITQTKIAQMATMTRIGVSANRLANSSACVGIDVRLIRFANTSAPIMMMKIIDVVTALDACGYAEEAERLLAMLHARVAGDYLQTAAIFDEQMNVLSLVTDPNDYAGPGTGYRPSGDRLREINTVRQQRSVDDLLNLRTIATERRRIVARLMKDR